MVTTARGIVAHAPAARGGPPPPVAAGRGWDRSEDPR
jgi:hypothetical protein